MSKIVFSIIKKLLLLAITSILLATGVDVKAAPALRGSFTVKQADGTMLTIEQFGDEFHHWTATTDGTIVIATEKGYCVADIDERGTLRATTQLAHEPEYRSSKEQMAVSIQAMRRDLFHAQAARSQAETRGLAIHEGRYLPHSGSPRILTILAEFQDVKFTINSPEQAFNQYLNGDSQQDMGNHNNMNANSVRKYFETCSHGQFTPQFDVVGPVTLPNDLKFYGDNDNGKDKNFDAFCQDAINQVKDLVSDMSVYDNDNDGNIELVCVIFAGFGENQAGGDSTIWAKAKSFHNMKSFDNRPINHFNCSAELFYPQYPDYINGTGVFIHELSHCMGLPDLYPTKTSAYVDNQEMESWSIMDYGLYNYNGFMPCAYTAWEQEVMGWIEIEELTSKIGYGNTSQISDMMPLIEGGKAYKFTNADNELEYIIMENIQQRSLNKKALGHGLLVYHVDYPYNSVSMVDSPNNTAGHPSIAVVPASGTLISSFLRQAGTYTANQWKASMAAAPFPGTDSVTVLSDQTQLPNYYFYTDTDTKPTGLTLNYITEQSETGAISFTATLSPLTGISDLESQPATAGPLYDLMGRKILHPNKGIYITSGRKIVIK